MQRVALIDYGSGNLRSAEKAMIEAARRAGLEAEIVVTADPDALARADRLVLPGVGAFASCRAGLDAAGVVEVTLEAVGRGVPFLGICVGMQLLAERGLEFGVTPGLGLIAGEVRKLEPADPALSIPHMGWNTVELTRAHALFEGLEAAPSMYFANSYALNATTPEEALGFTDHGGRFVSAVARDNIVGTQFHPEKSQSAGLRVLANFLAWAP